MRGAIRRRAAPDGGMSRAASSVCDIRSTPLAHFAAPRRRSSELPAQGGVAFAVTRRRGERGGMTGKQLDDVWDDWTSAVNMTASELEKWLDTDESKSVGDTNTAQGKGSEHAHEGESTGHESGRKIVHILRTKKSELTDADVECMSKVVGYVHRHQAQGPSTDAEHSRWRYSLMNWGNDPLKK
jgi:hypothetical protein